MKNQFVVHSLLVHSVIDRVDLGLLTGTMATERDAGDDFIKCVPLGIIIGIPFQVTPFGIYCGVCKIPIGAPGHTSANSLKKHCQRKRHQNESDFSFAQLAKLLNDGIDIQNEKIRDIQLWLENAPPKQYFRCSCDAEFSNRWNYTRHVSKMTMKKKDDAQATNTHTLSIHLAHMSVCGRKIKSSIIEKMKETNASKPIPQVIHQTSVSSNSTEPTSTQFTSSALSSNANEFASSLLTQPSTHSLSDYQIYTPVVIGDRKWITTTINTIRTMFTPYKRPDEILDPYLSALKLLVIHHSSCVFDEIVKCINYMSEGSVDSLISVDSSLEFFVEISTQWLEVYSREHVNNLDGKTRFKLQSFFDESILLGAGNSVSFTMREKESTLLKELHIMIRLSWRLAHSQPSDSPVLFELMEMIQKIKQLAIKYDNNADMLGATQEMVESLILQKYFQIIFVEPKSNAYSLLFGLKILMMRLFKLKKNVNHQGLDDLSMRVCGEFGSIIGTQIHIYRLAGSSLIACTEANSWDVILSEIGNSSLCHIVNPMINKVCT